MQLLAWIQCFGLLFESVPGATRLPSRVGTTAWQNAVAVDFFLVKEAIAMREVVRFFCLVGLVSMSVGCASGGDGIRASDPHLSGPRDMNYDHLIVQGQRVGPVALNGYVSDAIQHLGEPDRVKRSTFRGPGYYADEVHYYYNDECLSFTWMDSGVNPQIENGWRGINVTCDKWQTPDGLHVGSTMQEVVSHLALYCVDNEGPGRFLVATKEGIWFWSKDRNSPVNMISVVPVANDWGGMCKD